MKKLTSIFLVLAILLTLAPMNVFAAETTAFPDMSATDYYAPAATALKQLEILSGYPDGTFGADRAITRSEMASIVCRMIDKGEECEAAKGVTPFEDVPADDWATGFINVASREGIISGDGTGKFFPENDVKYEEAIKMVVCALGYGEGVVVDPADWSKGFLEVAAEKGISANLKGSKGIPATRGDIAVMAYNGLATDTETSKIPAIPVASKDAGTYKGTQKVKLSTVTKDATIYYTLDGTIPTAESTKYKKEFSITKTSTLKAVAIKDGIASKVLSLDYTIEKAAGGGGGGGGGGSYVPPTPTTYTVTFDLNYDGATDAPAAQTITSGEKATAPAVPEREGYTFNGWYKEADCLNIFVFDSHTITANLTLYACWIENTPPAPGVYTVTFALNYEGAAGAPTAQTVNDGEKATEPTEPERDGYTFDGWYKEAECLNKFAFDTDVITANITLYACWTKKVLSIDLSSSVSEILTDGEISDVYFYAKVNNNYGSLTELTLYDENGNPVSPLYDNGQYSENGDEFSNDDIFTCVIEIETYTEDELTYKVVGNGTEDITSNEISIKVIEGMTEQQLEDMNTVDTSIQNNVFLAENFENMTDDEKKDLVEDALDEMVSNELIKEDSIAYDEETGTYTFEYDSGALGAIILKDWSEDQNGGALSNGIVMDRAEQEARYLEEKNSSEIITMSEPSTNTTTADAIILWSFNQDWDSSGYREPFYHTTETAWENAGVDTTVVWDTTVEDYKNLEDYEIIVFSGHGAYTKYKSSIFSGKELSSLLLHELSTKNKDDQYKNDLKTYRIGKISVLGGTMYAILPAFWEYYYEPGDFDGSFFFAENCEFYGSYGNVNNEFANALTNLSAEGVIGFHNSVMADYSRDLMKEYVDSLIDGSTASQAFSGAKAIYGNDDYFSGREHYGPTAYPIFKGNANATLIETDFDNGSFEYGVSQGGWKKTGDVRAISKLGELTPRHKDTMAILTTGIGSGESAYGEATEGSSLYQTFKVPDNAQTLSFVYNVVSEEPMEYVGSSYDDKFKVEIKHDSTTQLLQESVNKSTWYPVSGIDFDGGDITTYQTGWKTFNCDISGLQGKTVTLRFVVYDVGDSVYDTATLVDNIFITDEVIKEEVKTFKYTQQSVTDEIRYVDSDYDEFYYNSDLGAIVPGLSQNFVPQGIAYRADKNQYYISGYASDEKNNSVIMAIDAYSGQYVGEYYLNKKDKTAFKGHAGGIAIVGTNLYVANGKSLSRIPLVQIDLLDGCGDIYFEESIKLSIGDASIAFCNYSNGILWIGNFWEFWDYNTKAYDSYKALALGYIIENGTFKASSKVSGQDYAYLPDYICEIPEKIQGLTVCNGNMILSQSYGRKNKSTLLVGEDPTIYCVSDDVIVLDGEPIPVLEFEDDDKVTAPPMTEGIDAASGQVVTLFESGAKKYREDGGKDPTDRLWLWNN